VPALTGGMFVRDSKTKEVVLLLDVVGDGKLRTRLQCGTGLN
jgi:hypothetical protein